MSFPEFSLLELFLLIMHVYLSTQQSVSNKKIQNSSAALHFPPLWMTICACLSGLEAAIIAEAPCFHKKV